MKLPKQGKPIYISLPVELQEDIGVGDVIKRVTNAFGIKPCKGCKRRAAIMNRFILTSRRNNR